MPAYKLTYFNYAALAEPIRWAFKLAEVDFEDERIEIDLWPSLKTSGRFPLGQVPLLEIDGEVFSQSFAILRYLGNKFGLSTDDEILRLRLDQVIDITADIRPSFCSWFVECDPEKKEQARLLFVNEKLSKGLRQIEEIIGKTKGSYIAGEKLTYGDLGLAGAVNMYLDAGLITEQFLEEFYPSIIQLKNSVANVPQIRAWLDIRPKTVL